MPEPDAPQPARLAPPHSIESGSRCQARDLEAAASMTPLTSA
jgi:hypothetical protein